MQEDKKLIDKLRELAAHANVTVKDCGNGHYQLQGKLLVNYYPFSKRKTAYVANTVGGEEYVSPARAVEMANRAPRVLIKSLRDPRRKSYRSIRKRLIKKHGQFCFWCRSELTLDSSTTDHRIPLKRGGLDNENNMVLSCFECNNKRGHNMPELQQEKQHAESRYEHT